jgi:hypothetical protein
LQFYNAEEFNPLLEKYLKRLESQLALGCIGPYRTTKPQHPGGNMALLHERGVASGRGMVNFSYHTKTCHETSIPHPQLV